MANTETQAEKGNSEIVINGDNRKGVWEVIQRNKHDPAYDCSRYTSTEESRLVDALNKTPDPFVSALLQGLKDLPHSLLITETLFRVSDGSYQFITGDKRVALCSPALEGKSAEKPPSGIVAYAQANSDTWKCSYFGESWTITVQDGRNNKPPIGYPKL